MLTVTNHPPAVQQHATTVALVTAAALAGSLATAYIFTRSSPVSLLSKGRKWWARLQVLEYEQDEGQPWPAGGFPRPPKCRPLSTVQELLTWQPPGNATAVAAAGAAVQGPVVVDPCSCITPLQLSVQVVPAAAAAAASTVADGSRQLAQPQLLVCHDMMGGYLPEESLLSGAAGCGQYRLWHWDCIDVFVYFSHHMVTIPPKSWIHAAHKNAVKVLGTFITEFGQGRQRCNRLFSSNASAEAVADQLVAVAAHYGFEGWLVNIENPLTLEQVAVMKHFVGYLRARMRAASQHGTVIWYDAVTITGELRWQNKLSPANAPFFDLSDGLFLNYCWTPATLPGSVAAAGRRATDVFVGVDVFGRGCYGGGGHNTGLALAAARAAGLSAALFAPGWVQENLDRSKFDQLQEQWWHKVQSSWACSHAVVVSLPFSSSFNAGAGLAWFQHGVLTAAGPAAAAAAAAAAGVEPGSWDAEGEGTAAASDCTGSSSSSSTGWFNMLLTDTLPSCRDPISEQVVSGPAVARLAAGTAYNGGSCLVLCTQQHQPQAEGEAAEQQQQQSTQAASSQADQHVLASTMQAPCCSLSGFQEQEEVSTQAASVSTTATAAPSVDFAVLQLFTAAVPVQQDTVLEVSCVYAAPGSSGRSESAGSQPSTAATPVLWIMTEPTAAAAAAAPGAAHKVIHLLSGVKKSAAAAQQRQQLLLAAGQTSDVVVELPVQAAAAAGAGQQDVVLGPVQFAPQAPGSSGPNSSSEGGGGGKLCDAAAAATVAAAAALECGADAMWAADLSCKLSGWQWMKSSRLLPAAAGRTVTGVGLAVQTNSSTTNGDGTVLGVLGQVEISVCPAGDAAK